MVSFKKSCRLQTFFLANLSSYLQTSIDFLYFDFIPSKINSLRSQSCPYNKSNVQLLCFIPTKSSLVELSYSIKDSVLC